MRYKVGDEVYLPDDTFYELLKNKPLEILAINQERKAYFTDELGYLREDDINHEKTAELNKKDKTLRYYQGELEKAENNTLEKIVEQRNNDEYTKALMKYGRASGRYRKVIFVMNRVKEKEIERRET